MTKVGQDFHFDNPSTGFVVMESGDDCSADFAFQVDCSVAGVKVLAVKLGGMDDEALVDLGSKADKVKQTIDGGAGVDALSGKAGKQKLKGGGQGHHQEL